MQNIVIWAAVINTTIIIAGLVGAHYKNRGYTDKRLEDMDATHKIFWSHINNRTIHEESMNAKLIKSMFELVENKIDNVEKKMMSMDTDMKQVRLTLHEFREKMPTMIATALELHGRRGD